MDTVDAVCGGHSRIVVYGGGDIVFDTKRSNQCTQYTVHSTQWMPCNSGIWWWGHCPLCHCIHSIHWFDLFCTKDNVPTTIYHYSTVLNAYCIHWFDLFAQKTMSPPPYTTIPLYTASTASYGLTFLHQRQCPHHHIPLFHCVLRTVYCVYCVLCLLHTAFTVYCIHFMPYMAYIGNLFALTKCPHHRPTLLITHETITNQKLVISNQYLMSPPPTKKVPKTYTF